MNVHAKNWLFQAILIAGFGVSFAAAAWGQSADLTKFYQRGSALYKAGMYIAAASYFSRALKLSEREYGNDSSRTGYILKNLATVYAKQRKYADAEPVYRRAQVIFESAFGPDHAMVAEITNELANVYVARERYIQAEPLLARILANAEREFGPDDTKVAVAAYKLASASEFLGDAEKARALYARALRIWQSKATLENGKIAAAKDRLTGLSLIREGKRAEPAPVISKELTGPFDKLGQSAGLRPAALAWRVQLASFGSRASAERELERLQKSHADAFSPHGALSIAEARLVKGTFYRVTTGPIADRAVAITLCRDLKAKNQACLVLRNR